MKKREGGKELLMEATTGRHENVSVSFCGDQNSMQG